MQRGFTLIELLVVLGIIGLLAVTFLPDLLSASESARIQQTEARLTALSTGINSFENANGVFPPDDFRDHKGVLKPKTDNGRNSGIESLVLYLSQRQGGMDLGEHADWLVNTDGDDNGGPVGRLTRTDRPEIVDAWGVPLLYVSANSEQFGFGKAQKIMLPIEMEGAMVDAKAWQIADGTFLNGRKYQLVSAGPDNVFNTEDDLTFPPRR